MNSIVFIDFPANIKVSNSEIIRRHLMYASEWRKLRDENSNVFVISFRLRGKFLKRYTFENLIIIQVPILSNRTVVSEVIELRKEFSKQDLAFVAADPWLKLLATKIFCWLFRLNGNIQIQIHGDVFDKNWYTKNFKNRIKKFVLPVSFVISHNIRVVSRSTQSRLAKINSCRNKEIIYSPVPLNLDFQNIEFRSKSRPLAVGILGRLHDERGFDQLLKYFTNYNQKYLSVKLIVAGNGSDGKAFKKKFLNLLGSENIEFLGELSGVQLRDFWNRIGVLASFAPSESYGRAIRESLCHGIPVLAYPSQGVFNLLAEFPGIALEIARLPTFDSESDDQVRRLISMETNKGFLEYSQNEVKLSVASLIKSWDSLFK